MASFWLEHEENGQTRQFPFQSDSVSVGRDKSSGFVLDHPTVSRQHALITRKQGGYFLQVLSTNGMTALNGRQVTGEVALSDGSALQFGQLQFRFRAPQTAQQAQPSGFGSGAHASAGFGGAPQPGAGFGSGSQPAAGFGGGAPSASGFGSGPQPAAGFGGAQGFGTPPPSESGGWSNFGAPDGSPGSQIPGGHAGGGQSAGAQSGGGASGFGGASSPGYDMSGYDMPGSSAGASPSAPPPKKHSTNDGGILSWDEIASSSEAMSDEPSATSAKSIHERLQANKSEEKTNPLLVVVAAAAILGLLYFTFFTDNDAPEGDDTAEVAVEDQPPLELDINCLGVSACTQAAERAYKVGIEKLDQHNVAVTNRFEGYKKLLEVEGYLEAAGVDEMPASMKNLEARRDAARVELDRQFRNYRVEFIKSETRKEYRKMAINLQIIQQLFPDPTAREYRWAAKKIQKMKADGVYPRHL